MKLVYEVWLESGIRTDCLGLENQKLKKNDAVVLDFGVYKEYARVVHCRGELPIEADAESMPQVLRRATLQDQNKANENHRFNRTSSQKAEKIIERSSLDISMVDAHISFDRKRAVIRFLSPKRVDFRQLVRELASSLGMKIEMRQVGVRDVAKMRGGIGTCGRVLCCTSWIHEFQSVNVRMAKEQHLSLNNNIISGQCGRLKCCLAFEYEGYQLFSEDMPLHGSKIMVRGQEARVLDTTLLNRSVLVRVKQDGRVMNVSREQLDDLVDTKEGACGDDCSTDSSCSTSDCDSCGE
ncbi:regulatory iron-sulfur-containing complex subunit RicT [Lentisphaera marina]|uniref:PSP1 domain-containing protein n=1 Tax=Lentisphaera marina TaxID=1111041 RepID=UPI00236592FC|nr:regulatory iron-sulfur-containing complex subunit RicT [Lentisphaera marina]MDD7985421.1 regulatory iron-sulfur-containing complex subunit RicT [Lentisphaera marina]